MARPAISLQATLLAPKYLTVVKSVYLHGIFLNLNHAGPHSLPRLARTPPLRLVPLVVKLEARLRIAGVPYKTASGSVQTAPKGEIPYIEITDGDDSRTSNRSSAPATIGDSTLIIKHLTERGILQDLNAGLSRSKEHMIWQFTRERWTENYYAMRDHVLSAVPYPFHILVGLLIYRSTVQILHGQGTGRNSAEIQGFREEAWRAGNDLLVASSEKAQNLFGFVVSALIYEAYVAPLFVLAEGSEN
ncbi:hypothetical protein BDW75DRAFT_236919 [Aspergillus navahoensis]